MRLSPEPGRARQGRSYLTSGEAGDLVCSYDLRGNIIDINEALERALGYTRQELRGLHLSHLLDPQSVETASLRILEQTGGANPEPLRVTACTKDGQILEIELVTRLVFEKGKPVAVQAFGKAFGAGNLDALRTAEMRLSTQSHELAQFAADLKQLHRLSTSTYESLEELFADYLATGCQLFHLDTGIIWKVAEESALIQAVNSKPSSLSEGERLPLNETHWASVADRLRTIIASGASEDRSVHPELRICLATPILVEAELYGTLSFSAREESQERMLSSEVREVIEMMARSIGRSIFEDRIRAERRSAEELERNRNSVLEMVAENRPLADTLAQVAAMLESHCPGALCSVSVPRTAGTPHTTQDFTQKGWIKHSVSPILAGDGQSLGEIILYFKTGVSDHVDAEVLRMASRLAGIAIEQRQLTERLEFQAQHDSLTGLPNRFHLLELLAKRLEEAAAREGTVAVLFIDLDRFKQINDTLGHLAGDSILVQVAERLKAGLLHDHDVAGRMGGDEFTVILSHPASQEFAFRAARHVLQSLRVPYMAGDRELFITASIGISFYPQDGAHASTLLQKADLAMYGAKNSGKNELEPFVSNSRDGAMERLEMENALRRALEKSELELNFQPIVRIGGGTSDGELDGLEVLLTWNHPKLGRISPKRFIPIAEETGLIIPIGSWVLHQACQQGVRWNSSGLKPVRVAVNVSALQFARPDFVDTVAAALTITGFPARWLDLELTESFVIQDIEESARRLSRLRELGVHISIDDFGTGYSSLSYLRQLPVDTLKIDQSFLRDLEAPSDSLRVVETIVSLAHNMNLSVVAEGVETVEHLELLRAAGCDKVQGHLYGESLPGSEAQLLLADKRRIVPVQR